MRISQCCQPQPSQVLHSRDFHLPERRLAKIIAGVTDAKGFADRVDFGTVVNVSARKRTVVIDVNVKRLTEIAVAEKFPRSYDPPRAAPPPPPAIAKAPERAAPDRRSPDAIKIVVVECKRLGGAAALLKDAVKQRFARALPKDTSIVIGDIEDGFTVRVYSTETTAGIRKLIDFAKVVKVDEGKEIIEVEFTPEQVVALGGEPARAPEKPAEPTSAPPPQSPSTGLLAHWSFDDGDGDVVKDQSVNGLDVKLIGCKRGAGMKGKGVVMTGKDQYVDLGTDPRLNFGERQPFTFSLWFRTTEHDGTILCFRKRGDGAPMIQVTFRMSVVGTIVRSDGEERGEVRSDFMMRTMRGPGGDGQWHHVALTRSAEGAIELFVDGERRLPPRAGNTLKGITTDLRALGNDRYLKLQRGLGNPDFIGSIDEVQIHGRALTQDEVRKLATK
jgi:hypothetical protein